MLTAKAVFAHVILIATTLFFGPVGLAAEPEKPNIVLVLVDNLGWGELGAYGGGVLRGTPTPRLDGLAAEGFRLTNFNVESECVPTRAALLTGRHPLRTGTLRSVPPGQPQGLVGWEVTLAEVLAAQGYATAHYGKWASRGR
jgi:arylsulfatase